MPRIGRVFTFIQGIALVTLCNACLRAQVGTPSDADPDVTDSGVADSGMDAAVVGCPCDPHDEVAPLLGDDPTDPGDDPTDCGADLATSGAARACVMNARATHHSFVLTQEVHNFDSSIISVFFGTDDGRVFSSSLSLFQRPDLGLCNPIQLEQCGTFTIMDEPGWTVRIYTCDAATALTPMCEQSWGPTGP